MAALLELYGIEKELASRIQQEECKRVQVRQKLELSQPITGKHITERIYRLTGGEFTHSCSEFPVYLANGTELGHTKQEQMKHFSVTFSFPLVPHPPPPRALSHLCHVCYLDLVKLKRNQVLHYPLMFDFYQHSGKLFTSNMGTSVCIMQSFSTLGPLTFEPDYSL